MLRFRLLSFLLGLLAGSSTAATFDELSARANAAREANNLPEAVRLYRAALAENPKWTPGWWFLGTILYDSNEYAGCREALSHFVELKTDAAPAWGILGLCEYETGEYAPSLAHVSRSLSLGISEQPDMEKVLRYHEAILLTHASQFDLAIQKYVWFVRGAATPPPALLNALGLAALRTPLLPKDIPPDQQEMFASAGIAAFYQMSGNGPAAQQAFAALLQRYPTAHHVHYLYGCSLLAVNPEEAVAEFKRELQNTPASGGTLTMLSWALLNRGDVAAALPYAQKAAAAEPANPMAEYVFGRSLVETGDVEHGIKRLETAEKQDPGNLEFHLALASAYPKARRYEDARRERKRSLELAREVRTAPQP